MIELRKRPQKPRRHLYLERVEIELYPPSCEIIEDGEVVDYLGVPSPTLAEVVKFFENKGIDLNEVRIKHDDYSPNDYNPQYSYYCNPKFSFHRHESEEEYAERMAQYKRDLKEYQAWYKENRDEIKATKAAIKAEKEAAKAAQKLVNKKKRLLKQQEKLAAELEKLG